MRRPDIELRSLVHLGACWWSLVDFVRLVWVYIYLCAYNTGTHAFLLLPLFFFFFLSPVMFCLFFILFSSLCLLFLLFFVVLLSYSFFLIVLSLICFFFFFWFSGSWWIFLMTFRHIWLPVHLIIMEIKWPEFYSKHDRYEHIASRTSSNILEYYSTCVWSVWCVVRCLSRNFWSGHILCDCSGVEKLYNHSFGV